AECARIRTAMDRGSISRAEIYADRYRVDEEARRAYDVEVDDETADEVQRAISAGRAQVAGFFGLTLSADEGPGFLRYTSGGFYAVHRDVLPDRDVEFPRRISVVLFLTTAREGCDGGSLRLYKPEPLDIAPRAGMLVAFPSDMPHEVLPVTAGIRDAVV